MNNENHQRQARGLLSRLFGIPTVVEPVVTYAEAPAEEAVAAQPEAEGPALADVEKLVKRLAKEIYKSNALAENAIHQHQATLDTFKGQLEAQSATQAQASAVEAKNARLELAKAMLPVVDAIEAGIQTGDKQITELQDVSPAAARILGGWLSGQQLLKDRVLRLLDAEGIRPMRPLNETFDPYRHVAVQTVQQPDQPTNTIVAVERVGYVQGDDVLRFAEVVVNQVAHPANQQDELKYKPEDQVETP